jgi:hypothetical protein
MRLANAPLPRVLYAGAVLLFTAVALLLTQAQATACDPTKLNSSCEIKITNSSTTWSVPKIILLQHGNTVTWRRSDTTKKYFDPDFTDSGTPCFQGQNQSDLDYGYKQSYFTTGNARNPGNGNVQICPYTLRVKDDNGANEHTVDPHIIIIGPPPTNQFQDFLGVFKNFCEQQTKPEEKSECHDVLTDFTTYLKNEKKK